jgi:TolB-like protein
LSCNFGLDIAERIFARSKPGRINSIAVLPLENRSNDTDADYISDGITESVNNSLARLPGLKVIPHRVALHYKGNILTRRGAICSMARAAFVRGRRLVNQRRFRQPWRWRDATGSGITLQQLPRVNDALA